MNITVTGRHLDVGASLRRHVEDGLVATVSKYFERAIEAHVVLDKRAPFFIADISVHVGRGIIAHASAEADDAYLAFNAAAELLGKRLRRHKRRLRNHHNAEARATKQETARQYVLADPPAEDEGAADEASPEPLVVAEMQTAIDTLTVGEAVMRLDLANIPALMFRNAGHGGLNMIYRRPDGNIGWVDPAGTEAARG